jgi:hypothetical protein
MVIAPLTLEQSPVQALKIVYPPMDAAPAARIHEGYEWLYVLSGRVRLALDGSEHVLTPGRPPSSTPVCRTRSVPPPRAPPRC